MNNKVTKFIKIFLWIVCSCILGFLLNYYVTSEIISTYFMGVLSLYFILAVLALIIQIVVIAAIIYMIYNRECPKSIIVLCIILYSIVMLILLFGRSNSERVINLNIMELFAKDIFVHNILNFLFFIPIGYILRKKKMAKAIIYAVTIVVGIELIQLLTARGVLILLILFWIHVLYLQGMPSLVLREQRWRCS